MIEISVGIFARSKMNLISLLKRFVFCLILISYVLIPMFCQEQVQIKGPGYYKLSSNASYPIKIPFKMHNGKPLMNLEINGKKASLMIDNGILWDQIWLFGSTIVDELNLKPIDDATVGGAGEGDPTRAYTAKNITLKFDDITFYEQPVLVSPPAAGFARMFPGADGQLCNTFFKHFIVEFDFVKNQVILHNPDDYKCSKEKSALDMKLNDSGTHSVPFCFEMYDGSVYQDRVDIDFGGIYALKIALNNKHKIKVPQNANERASYGAQGKSREYSAPIKNMTLGKYVFKNPSVCFGDEKTSRIHPDNLGVIGLPLFMRFNITFDYFNNKMYLEPNENFNNPIIF